ncbi:hypothetical protein RND81_14G046000 [Saponaria officinalis]|uniref:Sulfotransferase n=1 Tax=Saponaria officinalis TaxID=3572 RepID=A0AAW1GLV7_SAPOF
MNQNHAQEETPVSEHEVEHLVKTLPKAAYIGTKLLMYQGTWYHDGHIKNVLTFQRHFQARDTDLIIGSLPRSGTTWLKSLLFAVVNRGQHSDGQSPLLVNHPHELVYSLETDVYGDAFVYPRPHHLSELPSPRLLSTHLSYTSLPESIKTSNCRILYISRNPLDMLVSLYYFSMNAIKKYLTVNIWRRIMGVFYRPPSMDDFFQALYEEKYPFGPFFEHVIGYWKMSLDQPDKVLFLKYEDMKDDPAHYVKKIADFAGVPFSAQEEADGVITQIIEMCSIKNMKELEVNKSGVINKLFEKKTYFRKGEVGDWKGHFSASMVEKMTKLMEEKLEGTGLTFKLDS